MKESAPPSNTFLIRFWLERSVSGARWRGAIEHIPSGKRGMFIGLGGLIHYLEEFDILLNDFNCSQQSRKEDISQ